MTVKSTLSALGIAVLTMGSPCGEVAEGVVTGLSGDTVGLGDLCLKHKDQDACDAWRKQVSGTLTAAEAAQEYLQAKGGSGASCEPPKNDGECKHENGFSECKVGTDGRKYTYVKITSGENAGKYRRICYGDCLLNCKATRIQEQTVVSESEVPEYERY